ncbi:hypothetical protein E4U16_005703 [Claviceps sp. LM84 group G4]|nr:hypothetical protein E4U33_007410 [Claviceps sp. LM78 group G4]KAG6072039.1 hypothetical protein E4U16_005703 [Claviceps sp. LM84 group G4]
MRQDDKKSRFAKPRFRPSRGWRDLTSPKIAPGIQTAVGLRVRVGFTRQKQKRAGRTGAGDDPDQVSPKCKRPRGRVANCKRERWSEYGKVKSKGEVGAGGKLDVRNEMSVLSVTTHDSTHKRQPVLPRVADGRLAVSGPGERRRARQARDEDEAK